MKPCRAVALIAVLAFTLGATNRNPDRDRSVAFDVAVTDKNGRPVPNLGKHNFKLFENGVEQPVVDVSRVEKPLALVTLIEVSDALAYHLPAAMEPAKGLLLLLRPKDWGAVVFFTTQASIESDFTRDTNTLLSTLRRRQAAYPRDVALYDAVYFVLDRMRGFDEKTAVLLIASGRDAMSTRRTYAQALRKSETSSTMIYTVALTQPYIEEPGPYPDFGRKERNLEAEYTLNALAEVSGGLSFVPPVDAQYSTIHQLVDNDLRNQYALTFLPTNPEPTNKLRKLKVEIVGTDIDHNGKPDKLIVRHKRGY
jgi:VWFA-related protein